MNPSPDTPDAGVPFVRVRVKKGKLLTREQTFAHSFTLGRADGCNIQFADENVSSHHAAVAWEHGSWWLEDVGSTNGIFVEGKRITGNIPLPLRKDVRLGRKGPVLEFDIGEEVTSEQPRKEEPKIPKTQVIRRYFEGSGGGIAGERTLLIRDAFKTVRRRYRARYGIAIGVVLSLLVISVLTIMYYRDRVEQLQKLHATAAEVFYTAKSLELQLARLRIEVEKTKDAKFREEFAEKRLEQASLQEKYVDFLDELGISREKLAPEDWLIYRVARLFGECDVSMPAEFIVKVKEFIGYWQRGRRLRRAVARAEHDSLAGFIANTFLSYDLPPQFLYLAVQESGLDTLQCGPETRSGIAKGMWQFIPKTAWKYGLQTGPLIDLRRPDPRDERHNLRKSTLAAASYLRDLYNTDAQASGLLVMACYNWDETKIREMLSTMPENPRSRNFWNLLNEHTLPEETYNYVFYIVSAAVIGENPRLFGFDFNDPIAPGSADTAAAGLPSDHLNR